MKKKISFPLFIVKRTGISTRDKWFIRVGAIICAFFISALLCTILSPGSFGTFFASIFEGCFGTSSYIFNLLRLLSIYLLLALAVTPAFKMKFWNIGAEGQALMGGIVSAVMLVIIPTSMPDVLAIILALISGAVAGAAWAAIPTFFNLKFKTNETLFTLLMNYVATAICATVIALMQQGSTQKFPTIPFNRTIISIGSIDYLPFVIAAVVVSVFMILYLKKSKQGFELSVLGDSRNTARYVGMNISKVTFRTMIISGAISGLVGFLLVCGFARTLSTDLLGGRGFTSVLIAWLGHFNPSEIILYSFLVSFLDLGTTYTASIVKVSTTYFSGMIIGIFILVVVMAEFFVRYRVKRKISNEVSEVQDSIRTAQDKNVSPEFLHSEFIKIHSFEKVIELKNEYHALKKIKTSTKLEYKTTRKEITIRTTEDERKVIIEKLLQIQKKYFDAEKLYKLHKKEFKDLRLSKKIIFKSNIERIKDVIRNKINTTRLVFKSRNIVYENKNELNDFAKKLNLTYWKVDDKISKASVTAAHAKYNKNLRIFSFKIVNGKKVSDDEIKNLEETQFNYFLVKCNKRIGIYNNFAKKFFIAEVKLINAHNIRLKKKEARKQLKEKNSSKGEEVE